MRNRVAVYSGTRNLYHDMVTASKSLLYHDGADHVYFLIEDDTFPEPLPSCISTINISNQQYISHDSPNYTCRWTYMCLIRSAFTKLFPKHDMILSLDVDTFVRKPISYLWELDMSSYYLAAVEEKQIEDRARPYYNFGVVMMNLSKLRTDQADDVVMRTLNTVWLDYPEQDAFNSVCKLHILPVPQTYNDIWFNKPRIPDDDVYIKHYAAYNYESMKNTDDYKQYDSMTWDDVMKHKKGVRK